MKYKRKHIIIIDSTTITYNSFSHSYTQKYITFIFKLLPPSWPQIETLGDSDQKRKSLPFFSQMSIIYSFSSVKFVHSYRKMTYCMKHHTLVALRLIHVAFPLLYKRGYSVTQIHDLHVTHGWKTNGVILLWHQSDTLIYPFTYFNQIPLQKKEKIFKKSTKQYEQTHYPYLILFWGSFWDELFTRRLYMRNFTSKCLENN